MVAKLTAPDGRVTELTDEEYKQLAEMLDRQKRHQRLLALLDEIANDPDKESDEWWDDLEQFLRDHRVTIREPI